jgi:uncharacterized protein involved in oxidation of intracellular sulfur
MIRFLVILNDAPYGSERSYNGLRLADSLARKPQAEVRVFLMGDSVMCGKAGQHTPQGYYNIERMLKPVLGNKGRVAACGTCMEARGITPDMLAEGVTKSTLEELTEWTLWSDRILDF